MEVEMRLSLYPATTDGEYLPHETIGLCAAKIGGELCILPCGDQTAERNLSLESFLKTRVGLHVSRKIGWVVYEVLGNGVDLDVVYGHLCAY